MEKGDVLTLAIWTVRPGRSEEFISLWESFASWTSGSRESSQRGYLVQDLADPQLFISYGYWDDMATINAWRESPEFTEFYQVARELCESIQPRTMRLVAMSED